MSFETIRTYINQRPGGLHSIGEAYGTENFSFFLNALIKMFRPNTVVELGTGVAVTTLLAAEALKHNDYGHIWTIDDGSHWAKASVSKPCQDVTPGGEEEESHQSFLARLFAAHEVSEQVTSIKQSLVENSFFDPGLPVDMLFADATSSGAKGCADLLRYYLPRMSSYSSIFIDRASTIHHAFLFMNHVIEELNLGRIPANLFVGLSDEECQRLRTLVSESSFSAVHLVETRKVKPVSPRQNSRLWMQIKPRDYLHHNDVRMGGF